MTGPLQWGHLAVSPSARSPPCLPPQRPPRPPPPNSACPSVTPALCLPVWPLIALQPQRPDLSATGRRELRTFSHPLLICLLSNLKLVAAGFVPFVLLPQRLLGSVWPTTVVEVCCKAGGWWVDSKGRLRSKSCRQRFLFDPKLSMFFQFSMAGKKKEYFMT